MLIWLKLKSVDADSVSPRITSRSTMSLRHQKACLHHIPIVFHDQKTTLQSLPMVYRDIIRHDHRKMENFDRTRAEDLKGRSRISLRIHLTREDHIDVQHDETPIHQSPASN